MKALVLDVDGTVSPVHGHTAFRDDVEAGLVFGPIYTSPTMCACLDELAAVPDVSGWWLTSWSEEMRARMSPFPGRSWPVIADQPTVASGPSKSRGRWWKLEALEAWLTRHGEITAIAWCDDHLRPPARAASVRRSLANRGVEAVLIAPETAVGLTPEHLTALTTWARGTPSRRRRVSGRATIPPRIEAAG